MPVALVLSGGGSLGAFQVGAVKYLYEQGIRPDIICGCSVGAINGIKLAEASPGDLPAGAQAINELEGIWAALQNENDMYRWDPWIEQHPEVQQLFQGVDFDAFLKSFLHMDGGAIELSWRILELVGDIALNGQEAEVYQKVRQLQNGLRSVQSLFVLTPIRDLLKQHVSVQKVQNSGVQLRLGVVGLESGCLRYVTEAGNMFERNLQTPVAFTRHRLSRLSAENVPVACRDIFNDYTALAQELRAAQQDIDSGSYSEKQKAAREISRIAQAMKDAEQRFDACVGGGSVAVSLIDAVLASAAIPGFYAPVDLLGETYVDGGVREILPLQAAVDMGADRIYAIPASRLGVLPEPWFADANLPLISIIKRATADIMPDEIEFNEVVREAELTRRRLAERPPVPAGTVTGRASGTASTHGSQSGVSLPGDISASAAPGTGVTAMIPAPLYMIEPLLPLYPSYVVDPGLISINSSYGYMRAADVIGNKRAADASTAEDIVLIRTTLLEVERRNPVDQGRADSLRQDIRRVVQYRRDHGLAVPADANAW